MRTDDQNNPAPAVTPEPIPAPAPPPATARPWTRPEVWMLGAFSVIGLVGFVATFVLLFMRSPNTPITRTLSAAEIRQLTGPKGDVGPAGPAGARGAAGEAAVRVLRSDCSAGVCTAECADDEILLTAYCTPNRTPAAYPTERSAQCRAQPGRGKVEVVAACAKTARR